VSFQLNLALHPSVPPGRVPLGSSAFSVTLVKTDPPAGTIVSISVPAGGLTQSGVNWVFNDGQTQISFHPRKKDQWVLNLKSLQPGAASLTDKDLLTLTVTLGPDTFVDPFPSGSIAWGFDSNGNLRMPLAPCPDTP